MLRETDQTTWTPQALPALPGAGRSDAGQATPHLAEAAGALPRANRRRRRRARRRKARLSL